MISARVAVSSARQNVGSIRQMVIRRGAVAVSGADSAEGMWRKHRSQRWYGASRVACEFPAHTLVPMPALSPTMESGSISGWKVGAGDSFEPGDVLCEIETDKATIDFEAQDDGVIAKILREGPSAQDVAVGVPICVVVADSADVAAFSSFSLDDAEGEAVRPAAAEAGAPAAAVPVAAAAPTAARDVSDEFALSPAARHLSHSRGVDATVLQGTGRGGRVTKADLILALASGQTLPPLAAEPAAAAAPAAAPADTTPISPPPPAGTPLVATPPEIASDGAYQDVANNNMRKVIARRLTESKQLVPHYYTSIEVSLDAALQLRKTLASQHQVKVSVNDLIIRSSALALRDVPELNSSFDPATGTVSTSPIIDVSVAVATPTGLITPIVTETDKRGLQDISNTVRDLATRARDGKLQPHEYQGGTFCVSNLGMFGIDEFSAVINPPQAAILAVGGGSKTLVASEDRSQPPKLQTIMTARLSADRRVVDEATASLFLSAFQKYLSDPYLLVL